MVGLIWTTNCESCSKSKAPYFFSRKYLFKTNKITYIQVRWFVSKPYFSTKSPSTCTALRQRETSACMPCRYHSLSCSFCLRFKVMDQVSPAVTIREKRAPPSASKRTNNSEESAFLSILCSIVRLRVTHLAHHPWSQIFKGVRTMGEAFLCGLLKQTKPGSIILNRRQKRAGQGTIPTGHTRTSRSRKDAEVDGDFKEK
jgi:hypothetical protein